MVAWRRTGRLRSWDRQGGPDYSVGQLRRDPLANSHESRHKAIGGCFSRGSLSYPHQLPAEQRGKGKAQEAHGHVEHVEEAREPGAAERASTGLGCVTGVLGIVGIYIHGELSAWWGGLRLGERRLTDGTEVETRQAPLSLLMNEYQGGAQFGIDPVAAIRCLLHLASDQDGDSVINADRDVVRVQSDQAVDRPG